MSFLHNGEEFQLNIIEALSPSKLLEIGPFAAAQFWKQQNNGQPRSCRLLKYYYGLNIGPGSTQDDDDKLEGEKTTTFYRLHLFIKKKTDLVHGGGGVA